jgi:methylated-DNA-[protein]-cysteine S-methyltransferase
MPRSTAPLHNTGMSLFSRTMTSPLGSLRLVAGAHGLRAVLWPQDDGRRVRLEPCVEDTGNAVLAETERQLRDYFDGRLRQFSLPLDFRGTDFQQQVWYALLTIPYGETRSYAQIAQQLGRPDACRAVGAANGRNPVSIIAPCHRVVGSTGKLTGFAGGLAAKAWLLELEKRGSTAENPQS